jgi:uncharacterized cupin superfamily protein
VRLLSRDALTEMLPDAVPAGAAIVSGAPTAALGEVDDNVGIWEMTPGVVADIEVDEVFVVVAGHGSVRLIESGETIELAPGAVVRLSAGEQTEWTVAETLRKVYVSL